MSPGAGASRQARRAAGANDNEICTPVDNFWTIAAVLAMTGASQLFFAAAWVVVGGLGGQWRVNQALSRQAQDLARLDERLTKDQKVRAGEKRQEVVRTNKSIEAQAIERLAAEKAPQAAPTRPSTLGMINGGR